MEASALQAVKLSKRFGATQAIAGIDLALERGEIRALVGRNGAGKSTLVSMLTGLEAPDEGSILIAGKPAPRVSDRDGWRRSIACVWQHSKIFPALSCTENLLVGEILNKREFISWRALHREARALLEAWQLQIDVEAPAGSLTVAERQLLEIARAIKAGTEVLILDEPTARLERRESERLFAQLKRLKAHGVSILFISHFLDEIFELCDSVTVLRDGRKTLDATLKGLTQDQLVGAMVGEGGRAAAHPPVEAAPEFLTLAPGESAPALKVDALSCRGAFEPLSFELRAGECVGVAGLAGSGKEVLAQALAGLTPWSSGNVHIEDSMLRSGDVRGHYRAGLGFVPEDRHHQGLILSMSVADNASLGISDRIKARGLLGTAGFLSLKSRDRLTSYLVDLLQIKGGGVETPVSTLSGGNQQKVVLARALAADPSVLVLVKPTAGVDIRAKQEIFALIQELKAKGVGILMVSDEIEELSVCDRMLVMRKGRVTRTFTSPYRWREVLGEMEGLAA